jgi:pimeloyl-ACP methyl ester carboxylesterase
MRLAAQVTGEGEPVLLVHGFPDSRRVWREQVGPLADAGFRVVAPDLRGFGESERPEGVDAYRATTVVGDLLELLDEHGIERAHVIGHDWGSGLSWVLASLHPDRVRSLAALSVGHPNASQPRSLESREKGWYQLLFQFEEAEALFLRDDARLLREWLADAPDTARYLEELREPGVLTARLGLYRANLHPRTELDPRPLPAVAAPTLGLWSTGERFLTEEAMTRSAEHVTGHWRYERIEGASHWLQLDAPDRVNRLLLEHLRS